MYRHANSHAVAHAAPHLGQESPGRHLPPKQLFLRLPASAAARLGGCNAAAPPGAAVATPNAVRGGTPAADSGLQFIVDGGSSHSCCVLACIADGVPAVVAAALLLLLS